MSTEQREAGYYWCRDGRVWQIAQWLGDAWIVMGGDRRYTDKIWDEIDPTPIKSKENE